MSTIFERPLCTRRHTSRNLRDHPKAPFPASRKVFILTHMYHQLQRIATGRPTETYNTEHRPPINGPEAPITFQPRFASQTLSRPDPQPISMHDNGSLHSSPKRNTRQSRARHGRSQGSPRNMSPSCATTSNKIRRQRTAAPFARRCTPTPEITPREADPDAAP